MTRFRRKHDHVPPYKRSLGPVVGAFMTALTEKRILGSVTATQILVPPMEWDPTTGAELAPDFIEVGPVRHCRVMDCGTITPVRANIAAEDTHSHVAPHSLRRVATTALFTPPFEFVERRSGWSTDYGWRPLWKGTRVGRIDDSAASSLAGPETEANGHMRPPKSRFNRDGLQRIDHIPEPRSWRLI